MSRSPFLNLELLLKLNPAFVNKRDFCSLGIQLSTQVKASLQDKLPGMYLQQFASRLLFAAFATLGGSIFLTSQNI